MTLIVALLVLIALICAVLTLLGVAARVNLIAVAVVLLCVVALLGVNWSALN